MEISPEAQAIIDGLLHKIAVLEQELADLRRQLAKDSHNSSKPPSSDGLKKPPRIMSSLRGKSGKPRGGQKGHKGGTLRQTDTPDIIKTHDSDRCVHCQAALTQAMAAGFEKRQVFDLPEPRLEVTEHRSRIYQCSHCHGTTKAAFPEGVNSATQYGERLKAVATYLNAQQLIPEDRVAQTLSDLFGVASI